MPMRIVINGREVTNPLARFGIAVLGVVLLLGFALFILFIVLPLIGLTLALTTGIILSVFLAMLIVAFVYSLPFARRWRNDKRLPHDRH